MPTPVLMRWTVAAMLPAVMAQAAVFGGGVLWQLSLTTAGALATEVLCLRARRRPVGESVSDGSALVTAVILAVCLPPLAPWFVAVTAAAAAIGLAKHCYGGLGNNPFNPAMAGYALAFVAFPAHFGDWVADDAAWKVVFAGADAVSAPTPLLAQRIGVAPALTPLSAWLPAAACLLGGGVLLAMRIADWRLTVSYLAGALCLASFEIDALLPGGVIFAAFFVITDPATAATSRLGRWWYGFAAGALTIWLRQEGAHADGIAFAVLVCNMLAALFDRLEAGWKF